MRNLEILNHEKNSQGASINYFSIHNIYWNPESRRLSSGDHQNCQAEAVLI